MAEPLPGAEPVGEPSDACTGAPLARDGDGPGRAVEQVGAGDEPGADPPPTVEPGALRTGLPAAALGALLTGVVGAVVAGATGGAREAVSAAVGAGLVALFFWTGLLPVLLTRGQEGRPALGLLVLVLNYALRLVAALVGLQALDRAGLVDPRVLGVTVIVTTLVWTSAQVVALLAGGSRGAAPTTGRPAPKRPRPTV